MDYDQMIDSLVKYKGKAKINYKRLLYGGLERILKKEHLPIKGYVPTDWI